MVLEPFDRLAASIRAEHPEVDLLRGQDVDRRRGDHRGLADRRSLPGRGSDRDGTEPLDTGFTGITDARFYINDRSITVILGPGSLTVAHMVNESVEVAELVTAARVYARVFIGFLGGS